MAYMLNSTLVPALALAASLGELAAMLERTTEVEYLSRQKVADDAPPAAIGGHVAACLRNVAAALGTPIDGVVAIEHSRHRGLLGLRAAIRDLDATATYAAADPMLLRPRSDPAGIRLQRTAARGRDLALLLQHVRHHKAQIARLMGSRDVCAINGGR
jgi:hypothetical protein